MSVRGAAALYPNAEHVLRGHSHTRDPIAVRDAVRRKTWVGNKGQELRLDARVKCFDTAIRTTPDYHGHPGPSEAWWPRRQWALGARKSTARLSGLGRPRERQLCLSRPSPRPPAALRYALRSVTNAQGEFLMKQSRQSIVAESAAPSLTCTAPCREASYGSALRLAVGRMEKSPRHARTCTTALGSAFRSRSAHIPGTSGLCAPSPGLCISRRHITPGRLSLLGSICAGGCNVTIALGRPLAPSTPRDLLVRARTLAGAWPPSAPGSSSGGVLYLSERRQARAWSAPWFSV